MSRAVLLCYMVVTYPLLAVCAGALAKLMGFLGIAAYIAYCKVGMQGLHRVYRNYLMFIELRTLIMVAFLQSRCFW